MLKLQIVTDQDRKEAMSRERKRQCEEERKKRIFNARSRVIGVDTEYLDRQIQERKQQQQDELRRNEAYALQMRKDSELASVLEGREREERRKVGAEIDEYRQRFQKPEDAREFDLNDPNSLKKQLPPRSSEDVSISSAQKFEGEDRASETRAKMMSEQRIAWLQQQVGERRAGEEDRKRAEQAYMAAVRARDERALMLDKMERECRYKIGQANQRFNAMLAKERRLRLDQEKIAESQDNCAEMYNILTSDIMTENPDIAQSALDPTRKIGYMYKGMNAAEKEKFQKAVLDQIQEQKEMKFQEQKRDGEYEAMAKDISRQVALVDIQDHRKRIEVAKNVFTENQLIALQQAEKKKYYDELFSFNQPTDEFFNQFNTTTR